MPETTITKAAPQARLETLLDEFTASRPRRYEDGPVVTRSKERHSQLVASCRCGMSAVKPRCDGTHVQACFSAPGFAGWDAPPIASARTDAIEDLELDWLPSPRGDWSRAVSEQLSGLTNAVLPQSEPTIEDLHLALYLCYLPRFLALPGVRVDIEWSPAWMGITSLLEDALADDLESLERPPTTATDIDQGPVASQLKALVAERETEGPGLSTFLESSADRDQFVEFLIHRSAYNLIEADPHSLAIPRMRGKAKAALVEIQVDEYGGGDPEQMHQRLFADLLQSVGLETSAFAYLDQIPGTTLATTNAISYFASHASTIPETIGHLAAFEMTSTTPNARCAAGLRRVFGDEADPRFFDVHVVADAAHEQIAAADLAGGAVAEGQASVEGILRGADLCLALEERAGTAILDAWKAGESSLVPAVFESRAPSAIFVER